MDTIREQIQDTSKRIKRLGESSQEIGDIVSLINEIDEVEIATCISLSFDLDGQHLDLPDFEEIETHLRTIPQNQ